jgi:hypothetical protein
MLSFHYRQYDFRNYSATKVVRTCVPQTAIYAVYRPLKVYGLPVICIVLDVGRSKESCGQSFVTSVTPHLLGRSTSSDPV